MGMNPLRACSFARTKESIREIRHVYLDLDEDAAASLSAIRTDGSTPVPNFVLDTSSEKNQVIWRVDGLEREQAESLLRSLATQFCGDIAATDISRVLRMPGFANRKYNDAFLVRAIQESDAIYHLRDFAIHEDSPEAPRRLADGHGHRAECPPATEASPRRTGRSRSERLHAVTTRRKSSSASPTTAAKTKPTRSTMRGTPSRKQKDNSLWRTLRTMRANRYSGIPRALPYTKSKTVLRICHEARRTGSDRLDRAGETPERAGNLDTLPDQPKANL
jgi:hypothetical protein